MVTGNGGPALGPDRGQGPDRTVLRLAVMAVLLVAAFVALFSRLWYLQVLAVGDYRTAAKENRIRLVYSEPERGRILDRNGEVLVGNRDSLSITIDRQRIEPGSLKERKVLYEVARLLVPERLKGRERDRAVVAKVKEMRAELNNATVSPYKPVAVVNDVPEAVVYWIEENPEDFPGVAAEELPVRTYPHGKVAAHVLGYVGEIYAEELELPEFKDAKPPYEAGDLIGKNGVERTYDRWLRGKPEIEAKVVNSAGDVVQDAQTRQVEEPGKDLILSLDVEAQKVTERALESGIQAARGAGEEAPNGAVVVMDPNDGGIVAMASYPTYDPSMLADGLSVAEQERLRGDAADPEDDAEPNRAIQAGVPPGSTFKVVTAGAALANDVASPTSYLDCPPYKEYGATGITTVFNNWTSVDFGSIGFPESLEISCDTFYYELGWQMEDRWGAANGDGSERFQDYIRASGFGEDTGVDLPYEADGRVPDKEWCDEYRADGLGCFDGWLPGFTVNMSIGQGDLVVSPLQIAVSYAAIAADSGQVWEPHVGRQIGQPDPETGEEEIVREIRPEVVRRLPLDATELGVIREGLVDVVSGDNGTAAGAFAGFPLDRFPVAGKTGTAQIGESELDENYAWFVAYAPADDPQYVVSVYVAKAGHGGETAAPIARQVFEGLFGLDKETDVSLGQDASG
ncbi:MAG TPA: penicillin-binding protein 2 [Actinomycetota bacterium]|nr:penicillin-binding protein 2 [Actinomycetota bacterium]